MEQIPAEVIEEIENIFKHATPIELTKLENGLRHLDGGNSERCIYGLMARGCWTQRACELVTLCSILKEVKDDDGSLRTLTPLEQYIDDSYNQGLVKKYLNIKFAAK